MGDNIYPFENWLIFSEDSTEHSGENSGGGNDEDDYQPDVLLIVSRLLVFASGIIGNALVIFVIFVHQDYKRAVTHWYVLQLALADSLFLVTIPFKVIEEVHMEWIFTRGMCKAKEAILYLNYYASVLFLMVMSVDRYIAVCQRFSPRLQKLRTERAAGLIAMIIWGVSLLFCSPMFFYAEKRGVDPSCLCYAEFPQPGQPDKDDCDDLDSSENERKRDCHAIVEETCVNPYKLIRDLEKLLNSSVPEMPYSGGETTENSTNANLSPHSFIYDDNDSLTDYQDTSATTVPNLSFNLECSYAEASPYWVYYLYANFFLMFVIPFLVMSVCYLLIALQLKQTGIRRASVVRNGSVDSSKQRRQSAATLKAERDRSRVTLICLALVVVFVLCWLPFHVSNLVKIKGMSGTTDFCLGIASWTTIVAFLNSALNPYVYNFVGQKFIKKLRSAVRIVRSSVKKRISSFSSSAGTVRFRHRKSSYIAGSSSSATIRLQLRQERKGEGDIIQAHSSCDQQSCSRMLDSTV